MNSRRYALAAAFAVLAAAILLGAHRRIDRPRVAFCPGTDELGEAMPGLRLHALPIVRYTGDIRGNFFTSMLYSHHGLGDTGFYYVASGALAAIGLSPSDRHLWLAGAATNALLIAAVAWLFLRMRDRGAAYVSTLLLALAPLYVVVSQTGYARITSTPLLQVVALHLALSAVRSRARWPRAALATASLGIALSDGFFFGPVLLAFVALLRQGTLAERVTRVVRTPAFWWAAAGLTLGYAVDGAAAIGAVQRHIKLTLLGYVLIRATPGGHMPLASLLSLWADAIRAFVPVVGVFAVLPAWVYACWRSLKDPTAGLLAVWFAIAGAGVLSYYNSYSGTATPSPGPITTAIVALPSWLLVAWAAGELLRAERPPLVRVAAAAIVAAIAVPSAAALVREDYGEIEFRSAAYEAERDRCAVVKTASAYVRERAKPGATVFQLTGDVALGMMGEYYYGISYLTNARTGERNRLFDYGVGAYGAAYPPERIAAAFGVPRFDYYVEFLGRPDPIADHAIGRLRAEGATVVADIADGGRPIGRVWSFERSPRESLDVTDAARRWEQLTPLSKLIQQSLAGTAYHFGYAWPPIPGS